MITYFYSASTGGFYTPDIHPTMPTDVVEITEKYYQSILDGQSTGKLITSDLQGKPVLTEPIIIPPTYQELRRSEYNKLNQDEMRFDDLINSTTTWVDSIKAIKDKYPKGK